MKQVSEWQQAFNEIDALPVDALTPDEAATRRLARALIHTRPCLFQARDLHLAENLEQSQRHIAALGEIKKHTGKLDAVRVWKAGGVYWLLQGHHRLAVHDLRVLHATRKPITTISVTVCKARSLREALAETYAEGARRHLGKTSETLANNAWQLVQAGGIETAEIVAMTTLSRATVKRMRRALERITQAYPNGGWQGWTWARVLRWLAGRKGEGMLEQEAVWEKTFTKQWQTTFGRRPFTHPAAFSRMLLKLGGESAALIARAILERHNQRANPFEEIPEKQVAHY